MGAEVSLEDPENGYIRRERQKLLRYAIHELPAVFRDVVQLRHARECSGQEIANLLLILGTKALLSY